MTEQTKQQDTLKAFLIYAFQKRYRLLLMALLVFAVSFALFKVFYIKHTSVVTFLIDDTNPQLIASSEAEQFVLSHLIAMGTSRLQLLLFSDEMAKRLDKSILLGTHYQLNKNDSNYIRDMLAQMHSCIKIIKGNFNATKIEVTDRNKEFAATMANSLFDNLVDMNRQTVYKNLMYKKEIYNLDFSQLQQKNNSDYENLVKALQELRANYNSAGKNYEDMPYSTRDLITLLSDYRTSSDDLKKSFLKLQMTSVAVNDTSLQTMFLINRAYPQENLNEYVYSAVWSLGLAVAGALYYCFSVFFMAHYKSYFNELLVVHKNGAPKGHLSEKLKETIH
jgi:hypothetical protein